MRTDRPTLLERIRRNSRRILSTAFEVWDQTTLVDEPDVLRAARMPVYRLTLQDVINFHFGVDSGEIDLRREAVLVRRFEEHLLAAIDERAPWALAQRQDRALLLAAYVAGVFTPCMASSGSFNLALHASRRLLQRLANPSHRRVLGAGNRGHEPRTRYLMFGPVLASLAAHFPDPVSFPEVS